MRTILFQKQSPRGVPKKAILRNFAKFIGKHPCQSLFFNKVTGLRPATLWRKRLWHRCFPMNFAKFLRTPFFKEHLWRLLLLFTTRWCYTKFNIYYFVLYLFLVINDSIFEIMMLIESGILLKNHVSCHLC